jgi:ribosomal protein L25 (general stress protein Ctc)
VQEASVRLQLDADKFSVSKDLKIEWNKAMKMNLDCTIRPENSKTRALRRSGQIPATVYGHKGDQSTSIVVAQKDVDYLLRNAKVNNTLIKLNITDR